MLVAPIDGHPRPLGSMIFQEIALSEGTGPGIPALPSYCRQERVLAGSVALPATTAQQEKVLLMVVTYS